MMPPLSRSGALLVAVLATAGFAAASDVPPEENYLLHCSGCHGVDGRGVPGATPTLHGLAGLLEREGGREYVAAVPGAAQAPIDDAALADLLNWVLERFSANAPGERYTAAEVGGLRRHPLRDPHGARAALGVMKGAEKAPH